jgi:TolA-binding protein
LGEIRRLSDIDGERLLRIDQRFEERDERTDQIAQLGRISLDAALAAAKEAVGEQNKSNALSITKSENSMKEQVTANAAQTATRLDALSDKIEDMKGRIDRGEGGQSGARYERSEQQFRTTDHRGVQTLSTNIMVGVGLVIIGALALIAPHIH